MTRLSRDTLQICAWSRRSCTFGRKLDRRARTNDLCSQEAVFGFSDAEKSAATCSTLENGFQDVMASYWKAQSQYACSQIACTGCHVPESLSKTSKCSTITKRRVCPYLYRSEPSTSG
jgi:hypothetical protein